MDDFIRLFNKQILPNIVFVCVFGDLAYRHARAPSKRPTENGLDGRGAGWRHDFNFVVLERRVDTEYVCGR